MNREAEIRNINMTVKREATRAKYFKVPVYRGVLARFPRALMEVARLSAYGTIKHEVPIDDMGYLDVPDALGLYLDAEARHLLQRAISGEINHEDEDFPHLVANAWNALAALEKYLRDYHAVRVPKNEEEADVNSR